MEYSIHPADSPGDLADLEQLWNRNFGVPNIPRQRTYEKNPCGQGRVWGLKTGNGQFAGGIGWAERRFHLGNEIVPAGQSINLAVDGLHRSAGPAVMLVRALTNAISESDAKFVLGATRSAQAVVKRAGFRMLCDVERWTKPLRTEYKLRQVLKDRMVSRVAVLGVDCGLRLLSLETWRFGPAGLIIDVSSNFTDGEYSRELDELASRAAPAPIFGERTAAALEWRFRHASEYWNQLFQLLTAERKMIGYVVYHIVNDIVEVDDFLFDSAEDLDLLICEFLRHVRKHPARPHAVSITCGGSPLIPQILRNFRFSRREEPKQCLVCPHPGLDEATRQQVLDPSQWFLTNLDLDL